MSSSSSSSCSPFSASASSSAASGSVSSSSSASVHHCPPRTTTLVEQQQTPTKAAAAASGQKMRKKGQSSIGSCVSPPASSVLESHPNHLHHQPSWLHALCSTGQLCPSLISSPSSTTSSSLSQQQQPWRRLRIDKADPKSQQLQTASQPLPSEPSVRQQLASETMVLDGFAWSPPGFSSTRALDWMKQIPSEKVPKLETDGEKYRELQLVYQLPRQDLTLKYCHHVDPDDHQTFRDFVDARNELALDMGFPVDSVKNRSRCYKCKKTVVAGSMAVMAPRLGLDPLWHPACFTCSTCDELLVDLTYCVYDDKIYCERHYAENLKPRCGACDELIFSGQYTKALNKDWHCDHFCCWHCDVVLTSQRYVLTDDHPCCIPCYEQNFTNACTSCQKKIGIDSKDFSYKDNHWHEECFCCQKCRTSLVDRPFAAKNTFLFCGSCYDKEFASRCDACGDIFRPGMKKMEYKSRKWHDKCFQCTECKVPVGSKPFIIPNDIDVYCVSCFEEKFATKCTKCSKIMTTGGVTFKNEAWHRECFTCTHCGTMLAGQKFASRNDQPYCANCFGELFAKRCTACSKPITGTGGTRFISFEGRHWHSQCFVCGLCKASMAGKGFITDGADIICPDCAKEKLMGSGGGSGAPLGM